MPIRIVNSNVSSFGLRFLSDEGPTLETLEFTIRIGSTPTFSYFDLYAQIDWNWKNIRRSVGHGGKCGVRSRDYNDYNVR